MCEISFEGEGPSLREVHQHMTTEEAVTFKQQYTGQYSATVEAGGFRKLSLPSGVLPTAEHLATIQETFGLRTYFGPGEESGLALSGIAIYYQALGPVMAARS